MLRAALGVNKSGAVRTAAALPLLLNFKSNTPDQQRPRDHQVAPVLYGSASLFCILASYFVVLPLREDAAITLGTSTLPTLFICSLIAALFTAPLVSSFLNRKVRRRSGLVALWLSLRTCSHASEDWKGDAQQHTT